MKNSDYIVIMIWVLIIAACSTHINRIQNKRVDTLTARVSELEQVNEELKLVIGVSASFHNELAADEFEGSPSLIAKHTFDWMSLCTRSCHL